MTLDDFREALYNRIIEEFEELSLEERVNRLIEIYASEIAYRQTI